MRPRKLRHPSADGCRSIAELFSPVGKRRSQVGISFLIFKIVFGRTLFSYFFPRGYDLFEIVYHPSFLPWQNSKAKETLGGSCWPQGEGQGQQGF